MIESGDADAVVTGGSEAALTGVAIAAFAAMGATSPSGISRPFDARRDGFVMGEGAGVLVLEDAEAAARARRRGARRGARLRGHLRRPPPDRPRAVGAATRRGRSSWRSPTPRLEPGRRRLRQRPRDLDPAQRPHRDRGAEAGARRATPGDVPVSSTKSAIGHLLGAAGAVEAIATVEALRRERRAADGRLGGARPGPRPRLRPRRGAPARAARQRQRRRAARSRSRTRSGSAATTRSSAWRAMTALVDNRSPRRAREAGAADAAERLELLCDPGSFAPLRSGVALDRPRRARAAAGDGVVAGAGRGRRPAGLLLRAGPGASWAARSARRTPTRSSA